MKNRFFSALVVLLALTGLTASAADYPITLEEAVNGTFTVTADGEEVVSGESYPEGATIVVSYRPEENYALQGYKITPAVSGVQRIDAEGNAIQRWDGGFAQGGLKFTMPAKAISIQLTFSGPYFLQAVWTEGDKTLSFIYSQDDANDYVGVDLLGTGHPVTKVWTGEGSALPVRYNLAKWNATTEIRKEIEHVRFFESFSKARPTSLYQLFAFCSNIKDIRGLENLNTEEVTYMEYMFRADSLLTSLDLTAWDTRKVEHMHGMFWECKHLKDLDISTFNTSNVTNMGFMFYECNDLESVDVSGFDTSKSTNMRAMFSNCKSLRNVDVSGFVTDNVSEMQRMFYGCESLESVDVSGFNTAKVNNMTCMFYRCFKLPVIDVSGWDTQNATNMSYMFMWCENVGALDVSHFNTSKVTSMKQMFAACRKVTELDVSGFDTSNVTDMGNMFGECDNIRRLDVSSFNTEKVTDMHGMFYEMDRLEELDLSNFNTSNVTDMYAMFEVDSMLCRLNLTGWDVSKVERLKIMFSECHRLATVDMNDWKFGEVEADVERMFQNVPECCFFYMPADAPESVRSQRTTNLVLRLGEDYACDNTDFTEVWDGRIIHTFTAKGGVTYNRQLPAGSEAYTVYLPYDCPLPEDAKAYWVREEQDEEKVLLFEEVESDQLEAYTPYLISNSGTATIPGFSVSEDREIAVTPEEDEAATQTTKGYTLKGTVVEIDNEAAAAQNIYILRTGRKWKRVSTDNPSGYVPALRAYVVKDGEGGVKTLNTTFTDRETGVEHIVTRDADGTRRTYDLSGRRVERPAKGIYVREGKKVAL